MTFFLNLHGTTPPEQHLYIYDYFSIDSYAESHNMIVVTPSSVVEQWGNCGCQPPTVRKVRTM
jgi:poly(3-hydroxybutyrate) depolymerase